MKIANIIFGMAGIAQIAAAFIPAAHVRTRGSIPFFRLPNAGMAFLVLGVLTALLAFTRLGWWRAILPLASGVLGLIVSILAGLVRRESEAAKRAAIDTN